MENKGRGLEMLFDKVDEMAAFYKVIGDKTRVKILYTLVDEEHNVSEIASMLDMTHSAISHQLSKLKEYRLVKSRKEGKESYYSLDDEHVLEIFQLTYQHLDHH